MKVLAINGSYNKKGVTWTAIGLVAKELEAEGIGTDIWHVGAKAVAACIDCRKCRSNGHHCIHNDVVNEIIDALPQYDGLILGCPVEYMGMPGTLKAVLDRVFYATEHLEGWGPKPAAAIAVCRRAGAIDTLHQLENYFNCSNLITVNSQYWNIAFGWKPEEFLVQDKEGVQTMQVLGKNMAWLIKVMDATKDAIIRPTYQKRIRANFCR